MKEEVGERQQRRRGKRTMVLSREESKRGILDGKGERGDMDCAMLLLWTLDKARALLGKGNGGGGRSG